GGRAGEGGQRHHTSLQASLTGSLMLAPLEAGKALPRFVRAVREPPALGDMTTRVQDWARPPGGSRTAPTRYSMVSVQPLPGSTYACAGDGISPNCSSISRW